MKIEIEIDTYDLCQQVQEVASEMVRNWYRDRYGNNTIHGKRLHALIEQQVEARQSEIMAAIEGVVAGGLATAVEKETQKALTRIARAKIKAAEQLGMLDKEDANK